MAACVRVVAVNIEEDILESSVESRTTVFADKLDVEERKRGKRKCHVSF